MKEYYINKDNLQILTVYKPNHDLGYKEYKVCNGSNIVAEVAAFRVENNPEWFYAARTAWGDMSEHDTYSILCEYDYEKHIIVGEKQSIERIVDTNLVFNDLNPLVQVDNNMIGREWCFLASMGMVINLLEHTEYTTHDIANMYLNRIEVIGGGLNSEGYIPNSESYQGNTIKNIRYALEYRGIKAHSTADLSYSRAKEYVDMNGTAMLFFKRMYRDINDDMTIKEDTYGIGSDYDKVLGRHSTVVYGYDKTTKGIIIADPSPRESTPGPYTPDVIELWNQNGKYYIPPRGTETLNNKEVYKVYILEDTYFYNKNKFDTYEIPIEGHNIKQLSTYACMASIINKMESQDKTAEDIARGLLSKETVDKLLIDNNNIFREHLGRDLDIEFMKVMLSLRGYTQSDGFSYKTYKCENIKENLDLGFGMGILFEVYDTNNRKVWTHFSLIESADVENDKLKIMDPSGVGSYRLINKQDTSFDASFYGAGYTMKPSALFRYSL